jgi:1-acyl-sn-glycerol-3-phosphate acyltransferase
MTVGGLVSPVTTALGWWSALVVVPAALGVIALRRIAGFPRWMEPVIRGVAAVIPAMFGIAVRLRGAGNLPPPDLLSRQPVGPLIVVSNHVNIFDAFVIRGHLSLPLRGLELESHFSWPVYGRAMRLFGNIPVPHGSPRTARRRLDRALRLLEGGVPLLILPEGHRTRSGTMQRFMSGSFRLAKAADATILPVVMAGAFERQHVGSVRIRPGLVELRIGTPVPPEVVRTLSERELAAHTRRIMEGML